MIRVTVWNENVQDQMGEKEFEFTKHWLANEEARRFVLERTRELREIHPEGIHGTLKRLVEEDEELVVRHVATLDMDECGLTREVLDDTDVLLWWAHVAHEQVPDEIAFRVRDYVWRGMGIIFLHSAHMCKPMQLLLPPRIRSRAGYRNILSLRQKRCTGNTSTSRRRTTRFS